MNELREKFLSYRVYASKDRNAFDEIFTAYYKVIRRYVGGKVSTSEVAADIASDVFVSAWDYMTENKVKNVRAFLYQLARNNIANHYRSAQRRMFSADMLEYDRASDEDVEQDVSTNLDYQGLLPVLDKIHEAYREVIKMRFMDEMSITEIADALGKTPNNARVTLHRALAALKTQYEIEKNENSRD